MNWQLIVIPEAKDDLSAIANWYEAQRQGLGFEFAEEADRTITDLLSAPLANRLQNKSKSLRWAFTARFPYRVIYQVIQDKSLVIVIAINHCARSNRAWRGRL